MLAKVIEVDRKGKKVQTRCAAAHDEDNGRASDRPKWGEKPGSTGQKITGEKNFLRGGSRGRRKFSNHILWNVWAGGAVQAGIVAWGNRDITPYDGQ